MVGNLEDWVKQSESLVEKLSTLADKNAANMTPEQRKDVENILNNVKVKEILKDISPSIEKIDNALNKFSKKYR